MNEGFDVRRIGAGEIDAALEPLAEVLLDCVAGGASVGFMWPLPRERALAFWRGVAEGVKTGERLLLAGVRRGSGRVDGTVQLALAQPDNQPHRADLAKMLVHRRARRQGLAQALLAHAERAARDAGKTVLVLDTVSGGDAERLYARCGWQRVGEIPNYALMPDGRPCATTYFHRQLGSGA
ncbi:GNAT family N-acetyltransferase [Piscinibacter sp.]|uniref:GNAT family N-acetyltransferase n=1 Tax=Piscinibacter sp. TaxID=1903157 RepID=UPI0039E6BA49